MITENCGRSRKQFRGARYKGCSRTIGRGPERINPVINRVISRSKVSDSTHHWTKDCPHANKSVNMTENINIEKHLEKTVHMTLMIEAKQLDKISNQDALLMEAQNAAIVDTACTKIVGGNEWLQNVLDLLSITELKSVKNKKSHVPFKFGDGKIINSYQTVTFLEKIDNHLYNIKTSYGMYNSTAVK